MSEIKLSENKVNELIKLCEAYGNQPGELINVLHKAQDTFGYLPREVQEIIARNWVFRFPKYTESLPFTPFLL